jgi:hypothetical protein
MFQRIGTRSLEAPRVWRDAADIRSEGNLLDITAVAPDSGEGD